MTAAQPKQWHYACGLLLILTMAEAFVDFVQGLL